MTAAVRPWREGIVVGLIGYASVAVFYAVFDVLAARGTLFTVNLLGKAVFRGERDPSILMLPIPLDTAAIGYYNALHLVLSLAIGLIVTRLVAHAERNPSRAPAVLVVIAGGYLVTVAAVGALTTAMRPLLPWWSITAANGLASLVAASYLLGRHQGLARCLTPFLR